MDDNEIDDNDGVPLIVIDHALKQNIKKTPKYHINWFGIFSCFFLITTLIFIGFWLSETQYSYGILRKRYFHEPCKSNNSCIDGLYCDFTFKCQKIPCDYSIWDPNDIFHNYSLLNCPDKMFRACPDCPIPTTNKILSYYDFNEFPNHWIDPGPQGFYDHNYNMQYGACKEICARDEVCHGVCYNGFAKICWQMGQYYPVPPIPVYNSTYTCAMKTFV